MIKWRTNIHAHLGYLTIMIAKKFMIVYHNIMDKLWYSFGLYDG